MTCGELRKFLEAYKDEQEVMIKTATNYIFDVKPEDKPADAPIEVQAEIVKE